MRRLRGDIKTIVLKKASRLQQDYIGGACHTGFDFTPSPTIDGMLKTTLNQMNPRMYQYVKFKSVSYTWSNLKMYWLEIKPIAEVAGVIPIHQKPSFPKLLFFNSFMDSAGPSVDEMTGYYRAGGISIGSTDQLAFGEYVKNNPRLLRVLRPGRRITVTNKEARSRWLTWANIQTANPTFFTQSVNQMTDPISSVHDKFSVSMQLPYFKYGMHGCGNYTIDQSEFDGNPYQANRQLIVSFMQTCTIKLQCRLLRSDLVTTAPGP